MKTVNETNLDKEGVLVGVQDCFLRQLNSRETLSVCSLCFIIDNDASLLFKRREQKLTEKNILGRTQSVFVDEERAMFVFDKDKIDTDTEETRLDLYMLSKETKTIILIEVSNNYYKLPEKDTLTKILKVIMEYYWPGSTELVEMTFASDHNWAFEVRKAFPNIPYHWSCYHSCGMVVNKSFLPEGH